MGRTPLQQAGEKPYVQSDSSTNIYENTSTISTGEKRRVPSELMCRRPRGVIVALSCYFCCWLAITSTAVLAEAVVPTTATVVSRNKNYFTIAAYLPEWRYEGANFVSICQTVTQLILFSLEVEPTGQLSVTSLNDRLPRTELMMEARAATRDAGAQLLVCIGGNGRSGGFSQAVSTSTRRQRFVNDLVLLCDKYDLDGIDLNWEYPGFSFGSGYSDDAVVRKDYTGLRLLLQLLHTAFESQGRVITIAYYPDGRQEMLLAEYGLDKYVANMHAMAYDQSPGPHSTYDLAQKVARQGVSLLPSTSHHRITLGLPFYGRHVHTGEWKSYEDIIQQYYSTPWAKQNEVHGYYYNGPELIQRKTRLAIELGLGGVMIWEVGQDCRVHAITHGLTTHVVTCPYGEDSSLLTAIRQGLSIQESAVKTEL